MRCLIDTVTDSEFSRRVAMAATQTIPIIMVGAQVQSGPVKQATTLGYRARAGPWHPCSDLFGRIQRGGHRCTLVADTSDY